jgi:hypothetical protein
MRERRPPPGGCVDERAQSARRCDSARVRDPDPDRRGEDRQREQDDEPGGVDAVTGRTREDRDESDGAADRRDREAEEQ